MLNVFMRQAQGSRLEAGPPSEEAFLPVIWTLIGLSFCFLPFRLCTRWIAFRRFFWDDFLTVLAWLVTLGMGIMITLLRQELSISTRLSHGLIPPSDIPPDAPYQLRKAIQAALVSFLLLYTSLWCIKIGFLLFFYRLGVRSIQNLRLYWWSVFTLTVLCYIGCFPKLPYSCGFGDYKPQRGRPCSEQDQMLFELTTKINCGLDVGTDLLIATVPMSILWRSKIAYRQKGALGAIFGLVVFTMVVAIVRAALTTAKGKPMNLPWVFVWTLVEANTAIIVACVGSFRTLYVQHREKQKPEKSSYKMTSARNGRSGTTLPTVGTTVGGFETLGSEEALDRQEPSSTVERDKL